MSRIPFVAPTAATVGVILALSGCAALGGGEEKLDPMKGPLSEYTNAIWGGQDNDEWVKQAQQIEELVAGCMSDEGWEYIPVDQGRSVGIEFDWQERQTESWISQYGYGINLTEEEQKEFYGDWEEFTDPNQDFIMSLSETEIEAFYATLYGEPPTEEELNDDGSYEYSWEEGGCYGWAQHEVQGEQAYEQDQFKALFDAMNKLYETTSKDPRMKQLDKEWASCMADAGYSGLKTKWDAQEQLYEQQNEYWEKNPEGPGPDDEQLKKWKEEEIDIALADFTCAQKVDYEQRQLKVTFELEEQFVKDHKAELEELVAFAENNKK
jgi:hypothetical protein